MKNEKWFMLDVGQVEQKLKTNAASGLSRKAARSRCHRGAGSFLIPSIKSPARMLLELISDFSFILLVLCAVFALLFDDVQNGISVLAVSCLYVLAAFLLYYRTQRTLESMQACFRPMARVIRGGKLYYVDFSQVVVGDVLLLERGDVAAADLRLVTSDSLTVQMQTDLDSFVLLEKYAGTAVRTNEYDVTKHVNMVHAGSVIETGSARGIVTAVGPYTYIAAKTGGLPEQRADEIPVSLRKMKRFYSHLSMISLLCVLPFCLLSLFISNLNHGDVLLSSAFLTALSIGASAMAQLTLTLYKGFFAIQLRRAMSAPLPSAVRSADALDRLHASQYLFVMDGAALSDGRMHLEAALTFDGEVAQYDTVSPSVSLLSRLTALYRMAEKRSLSIGIDETESLSVALDEFCKKCRVDQGALAIQYPNLSYFPGNARGALDSVRYFDHGSERWVSLSLIDVLDQCTEAIMYGQARPLKQEGVARLQDIRRRYMADGKRVMILSVLDPKTDVRCFVGMLVLRDGTDRELRKKIQAMRRMGWSPIFFTRSDVDERIPEMPSEIMTLPGISVREPKEKGLPIFHQFGKYMRYDDVDEQDVEQLLARLQREGRRVAVLSFSDYAPRVLERADCVIACSAVHAQFIGRLDEEIRVMETDGTQASASCLQTLKWNADVLIARPHDGCGGLGALIGLRRMALGCYQNLSAFFQYVLCTHWIRLLAVALPMLFGVAALNARHILVCSFVIDLIALVLFWRRPARFLRVEPMAKGFSDYVSTHKPLWISATAGALTLVLLPRLMDWLALGGRYYFKAEFSFCAILYLHLMAIFVFLIGWPRYPKELLSYRGFWALVVGVLGFLALCFAWDSLGILFDMASNPPIYALFSFAPAIVFGLVYSFFAVSERKGK